MLRRFESCTRHVDSSPDPLGIRAARIPAASMLDQVCGPQAPVRVTGTGALPAVYPVTELATAAVAAAGVATAGLPESAGHGRPGAGRSEERRVGNAGARG